MTIASTTRPPIDVVGAVKAYGSLRALDGLDLRVETGEVHGFLGPNGAGKSTTIRMLLGLIRPDGGHLRLLGGDPWRDAVDLHSRIAYVPGDVALWPHLTGGQAIDVLTSLRGHHDPGRRDELVERFALDPTKRSRTYSKGNRQKVALVAALASDVDLLLLDEPTSGLDPLMEEVFTTCVAEASARGTTVLLSSHILAEVEKLCDRVTIVRDGRAVRTGSLADLRHASRTTVQATTRTPATLRPEWGARISDDGLSVLVDADPAILDEVLSRLLAAGVESIQCHPASLERIFLEHYEVAAR